MYESFYSLDRQPFSVLSDPDFLFLSRGHSDALSILEYGLSDQTGFTVITGEIGSGKTTTIQYLVRIADSNVNITHITDTNEWIEDIYGWILHWLGVEFIENNQIKNRALIEQYLKRQKEMGKLNVILIDEAQNLNKKTIETLRLISNINSNGVQYLKLILVGQPELLKTLKHPSLAAFMQRVSANYHLGQLSLIETRIYIRSRLKKAGGNPDLFDENACDLIFLVSKGNPRQINIICDTALVYGYADGRAEIDLATVLNVFRDRATKMGVLPGPPLKELKPALVKKWISEAREKESESIALYNEDKEHDMEPNQKNVEAATGAQSGISSSTRFQVVPGDVVRSFQVYPGETDTQSTQSRAASGHSSLELATEDSHAVEQQNELYLDIKAEAPLAAATQVVKSKVKDNKRRKSRAKKESRKTPDQKNPKRRPGVRARTPPNKKKQKPGIVEFLKHRDNLYAIVAYAVATITVTTLFALLIA